MREGLLAWCCEVAQLLTFPTRNDMSVYRLATTRGKQLLPTGRTSRLA